jgi:redox-regulated HSP33 family molecular chaperone
MFYIVYMHIYMHVCIYLQRQLTLVGVNFPKPRNRTTPGDSREVTTVCANAAAVSVRGQRQVRKQHLLPKILEKMQVRVDPPANVEFVCECSEG